jgi:hypothetical protein
MEKMTLLRMMHGHHPWTGENDAIRNFKMFENQNTVKAIKKKSNKTLSDTTVVPVVWLVTNVGFSLLWLCEPTM